MCGILAILGGPLPVDDAAAAAALDTLAHRGPDDAGTWSSADCWLGNRRLAILDTTSRGHQPMVDAKTGVVVAFNGEIYNYVELRQELDSEGLGGFESGCDTEVLLKSYLAWGTECVSRFNGMWAFVIWDPRTRQAFFARDRLGVKPFFWTSARNRLSIASEPKALMALYPELRRVDEQSLYDFLALGRLFTTDRSMYAGISVLPPAHAGVLPAGAGAPTLWPYWDYPEGTRESCPDAPGMFSELFHDAVRLRMRSDVPVGVTLSGGLDSTAILDGAVRSSAPGHELRAYTSVFDTADGPSRDERAWAAEAARPYASVALKQVPVAGDWLSVLERLTHHLDAPTFSPAATSLWTIVEEARAEGVKVLLEGQGADELLGGYVHHAALALLGSNGFRQTSVDARTLSSTFGASTLALWTLRERYPALRNQYRNRLGTASTLRPEFVASNRSDAQDAPPKSLRTRLIADMSKNILPALLHYGDAVSMAHSIESRQPFLDYRLVEFATRLPDGWKVGDGQTKRILREHLRAVGQRRIADRTDKQGFPTPVWRWLTDNDGAIPRSLLLSNDSRISAWCQPSAIDDLVKRAKRHRRSGADHLFRLVSTEIWLRQCIQ